MKAIEPLLITKLYIPPPRSNLVPRPRLLHRLDAGLKLGRRLALISAPAGYGKTTLISAWLSRLRIQNPDPGAEMANGSTSHSPESPISDHPVLVRDPAAEPRNRVAWLSLDKEDNEPARFFTYLVAALQTIDKNIGRAAQDVLAAPSLPAMASLVTALINEIATQISPLVLVLDDYHAITELVIHEALGLLVERQPSQLHLVIITRQDPPLPLSRLRARGQMTEIRQNDLQFTPEEAEVFLRQSMGLDLSASAIATLGGRTEGWIAGLQLAALALQGTLSTERDAAASAARFIAAFSGRHHLILDYLTDEVLRHLPQPTQRFLLQTSILERMCAPLCDAVLDTGPVMPDERPGPQDSAPSPDALRPTLRSQDILDRLESTNLFLVPLDDERRWYRYHHLFGELLQARLREIQPDRVSELHLRAARWYEDNGLSADAVHHALATRDFDLAATVIERAILKLATWSSIDIATLLRWLQVLPEEVTRSRPWLRLFSSRALYVSGQWETTKRILEELEASLQADPSAPDAKRVLRLVVADRASYAAVRGEVGQATAFARQALAHATPDDPIARVRATALLGMASFRAGDVAEARRAFSQAIDAAREGGLYFAAVPIFCNLVETQIAQGQLGQALHTCEQAMRLGTVDGTPIPPAGFVRLELGKLHYERNDLQAAERSLAEGLALLRRGGITDNFGNLHAVLAQIKQAQGDDHSALQAIQTAVQNAERCNIPRLFIRASAYQARIWLMQGQLDLANRWVHEYRQVGATEYLREFEESTLARVLLANDRPAEALALLATLQSPAEAAGRVGRLIEILALRALALHAVGDGSRALETIGHALALAEPEGYVRTFIDEGVPMARLLYAVAQKGIALAYVNALLAALSEDRRPSIDGGIRASPAVSALVEPLTDRELQVLQLLAQGLSNPEIAQRLFISLPTVKSHTSNIYGKLGVHSRKQAVATARSLGILPSA